MDRMFYECKSLKYLDLSKFNTKKVTNFSQIFYNCYNLENIKTNNFDTSSAYGNAFEKMFYNCSNIKSIDLSKFETSLITSMNQMFYNCNNIEELNLTSFNTSSVIDIQQMFSGCTKLKILDLSNFDTSNVISMSDMFSNCDNLDTINFENIQTNSLIDMSGMFKGCTNLKYVNLLKLEILKNVSITNILNGVNDNILYCIHDESKALAIKEEFDTKDNSTNNCTFLCEKDGKNYFSDIGICSIDCKDEEINNYIYGDKCVSECPVNLPYEYTYYNLCFPKCLSNDFLTKKCIMRHKNQEFRDELINQMLKDITEGILDTLIYSSINEKKEDIIIQDEDIVYQLTSSNSQNDYDNISYISLGECENKLKKQNNISNNSSILIFKIDYLIPGLYIPIVQYQFFNPETKEPLDLNACIASPISLSYPILKDIDNNTFMHEPNNEYYNDKCYPYTTNNGTDIILNDRKKEYNNNNLGLCENNCKFIGINNKNNKSNCECEVKKTFKDLKSITIDKDKLLNNFIDFKSTMNIDIILCIDTLFNFDGIKNNIGSYITMTDIIITIINCILFYVKGYKTLFFKIKSIIKEKSNAIINNVPTLNNCDIISNNKEEKSNELNLNKNTAPPKRNKDKNSLDLNLSDNKIYSNLKINMTPNMSSNTYKNINISIMNQNLNNEKIEKNKSKYKSLENYTDNEINSLAYKQAVNLDRRTFSQYYISLLKTKHILIFSFYTNDYNSKIIKITLLLFTFTLLYTVNSLFFQDSTIHKIYEDYGAFNFIYQMP